MMKPRDRVKMTAYAYKKGIHRSGGMRPSTTGIVVSLPRTGYVTVLRDGRRSVQTFSKAFWTKMTGDEIMLDDGMGRMGLQVGENVTAQSD
jgi:hypothetical protein